MLPGSGATDRDGNHPGRESNLLRDIANALAEHGIASLRYDKRGVGASSPLPADPDAARDFVRWSHYVSDVAQALRFLRARPGIDAGRTAIVGHSEGGMLAIAAIAQLSQDERPAALVLLNTPGRPPDRVLRDQLEAMMARQGVPAAQASAMLRENDRIVRSLRDEARVPSDVPEGLAALFPPLLVDFWDELLDFDPAVAIAAYAGPVLLMQGEADPLISAARDTDLLDRALARRAQGRHRTQRVAGMDHQMRVVREEQDTPARCQPAIDIVCEWMGKELTQTE